MIASGWGRTKATGKLSDKLRKVSLRPITMDECREIYLPHRKIPFGIMSGQLCALGNGDTCFGDSGGPLQVLLDPKLDSYYIVGITSFGRGCASTGMPGVYTRVTPYLDWIESIVWAKSKYETQLPRNIVKL